MATWAAVIEDRTLVTADAWGESWTPEDIAFVVEFTDTERDEDLAYALGRSLYSIWAIQHRIKTGDLAVADPRHVTERARVAASRTYTFIDGDVPPGW